MGDDFAKHPVKWILVFVALGLLGLWGVGPCRDKTKPSAAKPLPIPWPWVEKK